VEDIEIGSQEIEIDSLSNEGKVFVDRVVALRQQLGQLDLQRQEVLVLIQVYENSIRETLKAVEEPTEQVVN